MKTNYIKLKKIHKKNVKNLSKPLFKPFKGFFILFLKYIQQYTYQIVLRKILKISNNTIIGQQFLMSVSPGMEVPGHFPHFMSRWFCFTDSDLEINNNPRLFRENLKKGGTDCEQDQGF